MSIGPLSLLRVGCGLTVLTSPSPSQSSLIMWSFLVAIYGSRQTSFIWNAPLISFCFPAFLLRDAIHWFPLIYLTNSHGFWFSHIPNSPMYLFLLSIDFLSSAFATFCHSHLCYISCQNVLQIIVFTDSIFTYKELRLQEWRVIKQNAREASSTTVVALLLLQQWL